MNSISKQDILEMFKGCKDNKVGRDRKYIYIILSDNGLTKIGRSSSPKKRLTAIRASLNTPQELTLVYQKFVFTSGIIERNIHKRFKSMRVKSEWFKLSKDDVDEVIGHLENGLEF